MATTTRTKSERNGAAVAYLRSIKAANLEHPTYEHIATETGINIETVKRLFNNQSEFTVEQFLAIADVLGATEYDALLALAQIRRKQLT